MTSRINREFRAAFEQLPPAVQRQAKEAFALWQKDSNHPSLRFKKIHVRQAIYSVRVSRDYRAVGFREGSTLVWFWIGSHAEYDRLIARL